MILATVCISTEAYAQTGTFTDPRDGQVYKTVKIGTQTWMAENLNYKNSFGSWVYKKDPANADVYGRLYDWETANQACPPGWHLPCDKEWFILRDFLGGKTIAGGKLKEAGTAHWKKPNKGATNETGFSALPGGLRNQNNGFHYMGNHGQWWSSTFREELWEVGISYMDMSAKSSKLLQYTGGAPFKKVGLSVRCLKNN